MLFTRVASSVLTKRDASALPAASHVSNKLPQNSSNGVPQLSICTRTEYRIFSHYRFYHYLLSPPNTSYFELTRAFYMLGDSTLATCHREEAKHSYSHLNYTTLYTRKKPSEPELFHITRVSLPPCAIAIPHNSPPDSCYPRC